MNPHRVNIINTIQLLASPSEQGSYHRNVPVNVAIEMVCQWFDDFYHPGSSDFDSAFSEQELDRLAAFNAFFDERVNDLPDGFQELSKSKLWAEVSLEAQAVLQDLNWREIDARYDA